MGGKDNVLARLRDANLFREWLEAKDDSVIVGVSRSSCRCPIATYVRSTEDVAVEVGLRNAYEVIYGRANKVRALPEWALRFIKLVDALGINQPVSANKAREFLAAALN